jgi:toxin CcdB
MPRFDVYANPELAERRHTPYFLDIQNDHIDGLGTRMVIPLRREAAFGPRAARLNPSVSLGAQTLVLDTAALGAVPLSELRKPVGELRSARPDVQSALDALFGSY